MITALVLFGILAVCAFLEWIVMIPLAGRDRMKAWKEVDPQGWGHFKLLMGFPFLAVLIVVVMINFGWEKYGQDAEVRSDGRICTDCVCRMQFSNRISHQEERERSFKNSASKERS